MIRKHYDLICVGGGIMSATLALLTKLLDPSLTILILEKLENVAQESSDTWNNAGTGHSALCELNYTPQNSDGSVDITKAIQICNQFEISKQFWAYLTENGFIENPSDFIVNIPHHSWVTGKDNVDYLKKRYEVMQTHFMFKDIAFTTEQETMMKWFPLIAAGRETQTMAASRIERGCEMNFGALSRKLYQILEKDFDTSVLCNHEVLDIDPDSDNEWSVEIEDAITKKHLYTDAKHVFIGAGGGSLLLLQKVEIPQKDGYGGFPVSGEWLVCKNQSVIDQHFAKVYSKAGIGDPPMSVPHLDTRFIKGKRELLFGPFAGFSPKFLKEGSYADLFKSIKLKNLHPMLGAFWHNLPLTEYLIKQVSMSFSDRMDALREFVKDAKDDDWEIQVAGQRVQIIKKDEFEGGKLEFGTEVISSIDGSVTCLLGASPGASTSVKIMLDVLEKAFPELIAKSSNRAKLEKIVPSWKKEVSEELFKTQLEITTAALEL